MRRLADLPSPGLPRREDWVPPPRFGTVRFADFRPAHPTQAEALAAVQAFAHAPPPRRAWAWRRSEPVGTTGLYLDGGFGVGKTHLLAALWHASPEPRKVYLSFAELVAAIGTLGMPRALEELGHERLYCIDEFELDDPGNTLIVKTFLAHVFDRGARVLTTSNTAPNAQGEGRFDAASFRREIQSIAARFRTVRIDGPDHRFAERDRALLAPSAVTSAPDDAVHAPWSELHTALASLHPVRYGAWGRSARAFVVAGAEPIPDQQRALRWVHFIDKLYDQRVPLWLTGTVALADLFDPHYAAGAYAKKHDRCRSRLAEMLAEAEATTLAPAASG
ncbi:MAG: cell division protein ZapE [Trueperaceae bacterium]